MVVAFPTNAGLCVSKFLLLTTKCLTLAMSVNHPVYDRQAKLDHSLGGKYNNTRAAVVEWGNVGHEAKSRVSNKKESQDNERLVAR